MDPPRGIARCCLSGWGYRSKLLSFVGLRVGYVLFARHGKAGFDFTVNGPVRLAGGRRQRASDSVRNYSLWQHSTVGDMNG